MSETQIMKNIQLAVSKAGHRVWRNNVGFAKTSNGCDIKFGLCVGSSDLVGIVGDGSGRILCIEVKLNKNKIPTTEQINFINNINKMGGVAFVAWSVEQALEEISSRIK